MERIGVDNSLNSFQGVSGLVDRSVASRLTLPLILILFFASAACSIRKYAINQLGDALAHSSATFASDDDPELIRGALPLSLKLLAACSGFTQFSYAFVQQDADEMESRDLAASQALQRRARNLYLRARNYGIRGLEVKYRDFGKALRSDPKTTVGLASAADVPWLYWTAAAWGSAVALSKDDPELVADLPIVEALIDRALQLDEDYDHGAIHSLLITYETSRQGGKGDPAERSRQHFDRAMALSGAQLASPLVALAEAVSVGKQNRQEFESLLNRAIEIDLNARPEWRLSNLVMQRRARWLLSRADELFVE